MPSWLRDLRSRTKADESTAEVAPGPPPHKAPENWLDNLRAAAAAQDSGTSRGEAGAEASAADETPIPRWFANIRPPSGPSPASTSSSTATPADQAPGNRTTQSSGAESLPSWLIELQSDLAMEETSGAGDAAKQVPAFAPVPAEKPQDELPEWLRELQSVVSEDEPADSRDSSRESMEKDRRESASGLSRKLTEAFEKKESAGKRETGAEMSDRATDSNDAASAASKG